MGLGMSGLGDVGGGIGSSIGMQIAFEASAEAQREVRDLRYHLARLTLMNQAMWELIRERLKLTDEILNQKAQEVDLRDGVQDGIITHGPLRCPKCGRVSNAKHWRCLYCGQQFEKPIME
jgi:lipopolysaccharide biosynthesis regulator YciM